MLAAVLRMMHLLLRVRFAGFVALCVGLLLAPALPAQSTWAQIPPTVSANLWGACYGGGQFVAVGERGTILTSDDGFTWRPRTSGTTAWLTSVAYGFNHYVAVGADRTVISSLDGVTWTPFTDFSSYVPRERLNVVGFDHDRFLTYGERDFALSLQLPLRTWGITSRQLAPAGWWRAFATGLGRFVVTGETGLAVYAPGYELSVSDRQSVTLPSGTRTLSGIVFDHETFTAVGDTGTIIASTDAITWSPQSSGTAAHLQAITAFNNTLIAVGAGGTILSQTAPAAWTAARNPATTELLLALAASDTAAIAVGANGTILRSTATPAAPSFAISPVSVSETLGGAASFVARARGSLPLRYQWSRNGVALPGETHSTLIRAPLVATDVGTYTLTATNPAGTATSPDASLTLLPAPPALVDPTFRADAALGGYPSALLALPDGGVLLATYAPARLVKLTASGALDATWPVSLFDSTPDTLTPQPDGRILVSGYFTTHNGINRPRLLRLNRDGTLDATFSPHPDATARPAPRLAVQADGKILVANAGPVPLRLLPDGTLDSSFQPGPLEPVRPFPELAPRPWLTSRVAATRGGKILVASDVDLSASSSSWRVPGSVLRLLADGSVDRSFSEQRLDGFVSQLSALDDEGVLLLVLSRESQTSPPRTISARLRNDGTPYPGYRIPTFFSPYAYLYPDGRLLARDYTQVSPIRYTALGAVDPTFTGGIGEATLFAPTVESRVFVAGSFAVYDGIPSNRVVRLNPVSLDTSSFTAPRILAFSADKSVVTTAEPITFRAAVTGSGPLTYDWSVGYGPSNPIVTRTTSPSLTRTFAPVPFLSEPYHSDPPWVQLTVRNARGEATSSRLDFTLIPDPLAIVAQPTRVSAQTGRSLSITVTLSASTGQLAYTWRRNDQLLIPGGPQNPQVTSLEISAVAPTDAGTYTLTITNALGLTVTSAPITITVDDSSRFTNLSTRAFIGNGDQSAIAGFVITGTRPRTVLIRGIGPSLAKFGVPATLADPQLTLFDRTGQTNPAWRNDDWSTNADAGATIPFLLGRFAALGAFTLDRDTKDAALHVTLPPGTYTVQLSAPPGQTGTALLELYEADNDAARILNLSTRALVTPAAPAFAGFAIRGSVPKTVLVRAAGPTLAAFGVTNPLARPRLTVRDSTGTAVATNSFWETAPDRPALLRATQSVGAFPFATGSNDAALLLTLAPGNYTAVIESADTTSGLVLAEIYEVP